MTDTSRPKRVGPRRLYERREGSIRSGDRRSHNTSVEEERRSGLDRRDDERRSVAERRSGMERRRKAK